MDDRPLTTTETYVDGLRSVPTSSTTPTTGEAIAHQLERIADALERMIPRCGALGPMTRKPCGLDPKHKGYHVPMDGAETWLED
jgi:hypothetical protein